MLAFMSTCTKPHCEICNVVICYLIYTQNTRTVVMPPKGAFTALVRAQCSQAWARTKDSEGDEDTEVSIHRILYAWLLFWQSSQEWLWQLLEVNPISNLTKDISFHWLIRKFLLTYCLLVTEKLKNIPSVEVHPCELYSGCGLYK